MWDTCSPRVILSEDPDGWRAANEEYLRLALSGLKEQLRDLAVPESESFHAPPAEPAGLRPRLQGLAASMSPTPMLERLCSTFDLSGAERVLVLLCAGWEIDREFAVLCLTAGRQGAAGVTLHLAQRVTGEREVEALWDESRLMRLRILRVGSGEPLVLEPLRLDRSVLFTLLGQPTLPAEWTVRVRDGRGAFGTLTPGCEGLARELAQSLGGHSDPSDPAAGPEPVLQVCGGSVAERRALVAAAAMAAGRRWYRVSDSDLIAPPDEALLLCRLWERETALHGHLLLVEQEVSDDPQRRAALCDLIEELPGHVVVSGDVPLPLGCRQSLRFEVPPPVSADRATLWREALGPAASRLDGRLEALAGQFALDPGQVQAVVEGVRPDEDDDPAGLGDRLWDACRQEARPKVDDVAQRIDAMATWEHLVLPGHCVTRLRQVALHARRRIEVGEGWGFSGRTSRGLSLTTLFTGQSGTGKTMAAEVIANELRLDLYRIDLSCVVSKWIGETEKHLRRVFDAAEGSGAILLFDEADALFGKRTAVRDSHDRYANIEVSYLLQRLETYRGLAILTTNMRESVDDAFLRRIRFMVDFPFPGPVERKAIWQKVFPERTPVEQLDFDKLAKANLAGGSIWNVAFSAACFAAAEGSAVGMRHVHRAARAEYEKLSRDSGELYAAQWVPEETNR